MSDPCCCGRYVFNDTEEKSFRINDTVHQRLGAFCGPWWQVDLANCCTERDALAERVRELERLVGCPPVVTRELARAREGRDKAEARVATLEKTIRDAPHTIKCSYSYCGQEPCTCWKAAALAGNP